MPISLEEAQARAAAMPHPKVTKELIEQRIRSVEYIAHGRLTICIIEMENSFMVIGKAAPADPGNYDPEIGKRYAYEDAFKQIWHLEGYLLCEKLTQKVVL